MEKEVFVVLATHNTGHGEAGDAVQLTGDARKAIATARDIEKFGYEFYSDGTGVTVVRLELERRPYRKGEFKWFGDAPPRTVVFGRTHWKDDGWEELWFDEDLEKEVDGARYSGR